MPRWHRRGRGWPLDTTASERQKRTAWGNHQTSQATSPKSLVGEKQPDRRKKIAAARLHQAFLDGVRAGGWIPVDGAGATAIVGGGRRAPGCRRHLIRGVRCIWPEEGAGGRCLAKEVGRSASGTHGLQGKEGSSSGPEREGLRSAGSVPHRWRPSSSAATEVKYVAAHVAAVGGGGWEAWGSSPVLLSQESGGDRWWHRPDPLSVPRWSPAGSEAERPPGSEVGVGDEG